MTLPFFYEPLLASSNGHFQLSEETSKHCIQVLRMKTGEQLQLTNGKGALFKARILSEDKKKAVALIEEELLLPRHLKKISIAVSLLKNPARFEWFLEKATEIGVSEIIPLLCERTEHTRFRIDRMKQILVSAMLQSQQVWLPALREPTLFKVVLVSAGYGLRLVAHCEDDARNSITEFPPFSDAQILIGPEGDFTPHEIKTAMNHHYLPVTLGETRLRTETAGVVAATLLVNK